MPVTQKLKNYLEKKNINPKDAPKLLLSFKACMYLTWIGLMPLCGKFRPIRRFFSYQGPRRFRDRLIARYPQQYAHWETSIMRTSEWFGSRKWVKWIPETFGQKHKDFGLAVAEATLLYKIFFPIWAPLEFMAIVRFYQRRWHATLPTIEEYQKSAEFTSEIDVYKFFDNNYKPNPIDMNNINNINTINTINTINNNSSTKSNINLNKDNDNSNDSHNSTASNDDNDDNNKNKGNNGNHGGTGGGMSRGTYQNINFEDESHNIANSDSDRNKCENNKDNDKNEESKKGEPKLSILSIAREYTHKINIGQNYRSPMKVDNLFIKKSNANSNCSLNTMCVASSLIFYQLSHYFSMWNIQYYIFNYFDYNPYIINIFKSFVDYCSIV